MLCLPEQALQNGAGLGPPSSAVPTDHHLPMDRQLPLGGISFSAAPDERVGYLPHQQQQQRPLPKHQIPEALSELREALPRAQMSDLQTGASSGEDLRTMYLLWCTEVLVSGGVVSQECLRSESFAILTGLEPLALVHGEPHPPDQEARWQMEIGRHLARGGDLVDQPRGPDATSNPLSNPPQPHQVLSSIFGAAPQQGEPSHMGPLKRSASADSLPAAAAAASAEDQQAPDPVVVKRHISLWTEKEKAAFIDAYKQHGRNWSKLSEAVASKTLTQIKNYYQNYKVKVGQKKLL